MNKDFADRLFELRKSHGLSQEELAEKIGVSRQAVSKWERSEASPDTDNIIELSKIYGISLDELVHGKNDSAEGSDNKSGDIDNTAENENEQADDTGGDTQEPPEKDHVSFKNGIHVRAKNGDKVDISFKDGIHVVNNSKGDRVHVGWDGVHVEENNGDRVHVGRDGVHFEESNGDRVHVGRDGIHVNEKDRETDKSRNGRHIFINGKEKSFYKWWKNPIFDIFPIVVLVCYLVFGFLGICGGFAAGWVHFLLIPIYYSVLAAIGKHKAKKFAYAIFVLYVYLFIGMYFAVWHPTWAVFITIPLYYCIMKLIRKSRKKQF